ncbi:MAG: hypothetical protein ACD_33C00002G0040 [uncultured bacterium]|nr:MAG: hypothetical protein ACD_33C00002G0040 [uncultured bacterium]
MEHLPIISEYLLSSDERDCKIINNLEREYLIKRNPILINYLFNKNGNDSLFKYIDQNKLLDLYPEYTTIYGPYIDYNSDEQILILYIKNKREIKLKTIYFKRAIEEIRLGYKLSDVLDISKYQKLLEMLSSYVIVNPKCVRVYYTPYVFNEEEKRKIFELYPETKIIYKPSYSKTNNSIKVRLSNNIKIDITLVRLLYEIHITKKRLTLDEKVIFKNGKTTDIRLENLELINLIEENNKAKKEAIEKYGLDVDKLLELYSPLGFNKFTYISQFPIEYKENSGRRYIILAKNGLNIRHTILLSRALMEVKEDRILDEYLETVDHIDRNNQNDNINNLRIIAKNIHSLEDSVFIEVDPVNCPVCDNLFIPNRRQRTMSKINKLGIFCSYLCSMKAKKLYNFNNLKSVTHKDLIYRYYVLDKTDLNKKKIIYLKAKTRREAFKELDQLINK